MLQPISGWIAAMPAPFSLITGYAMAFNALFLLVQFLTWCEVERRNEAVILATYELRKRWSTYERWLPGIVGASLLMAFRRSGEGPTGRAFTLALIASQVPVFSSLLLLVNVGVLLTCLVGSCYYALRPSARRRLDLYPDYS